jgi:hypothetical protein
MRHRHRLFGLLFIGGLSGTLVGCTSGELPGGPKEPPRVTVSIPLRKAAILRGSSHERYSSAS